MTNQPLKILAADKLAAEGLEFIRQQSDCQLINKPGLSEDELAGIVGEHDGMVVRSAVQVTAKVLAKPGRLRVIARAGVGVDNIDLDAATAAGILVMNSAEASTISTAEHAFTLMMALARHVGPAYRTMAEGKWDRSAYTGTQLHGKTLGIVGLGRIGRTVAERALAFGMSVVGFDPFINAESIMDGSVKMFSSFDEMLPHADIVTFHVPLNDETRNMLSGEQFARCRKGLLVVNAARGGVVDEEAIIPAIESGQCGGAALDVFSEEPPPADSPLRTHPRILCTPHLGASTREGQKAVSIAAVEQLLEYLRGQGVRGAVNAPGLRVDLNPTQQCLVDLAGRMAQVINPMVTRGISGISIEIEGRDVRAAVGMVERAILVGLLSKHLDVPVNMINVKPVCEQRGIDISSTVREDSSTRGNQLTLTISGPKTAVDDATHPEDRVRRIVGRVFEDLQPRVVEINGYHMDMIPADDMVLIQNEDRPGMVGLVGGEFGEAKVNIADMAISRRDKTALMLLKVDGTPDESLGNRLKARPGILKVAVLKLPPLAEAGR
ncbi:MAG: phosphoglycerate dehydrogenase [Phycisphaeraceae bacterium]|nr:phosphoglycerate dehydrogenase [Phycisphaeraceae bacterium]